MPLFIRALLLPGACGADSAREREVPLSAGISFPRVVLSIHRAPAALPSAPSPFFFRRFLVFLPTRWTVARSIRSSRPARPPLFLARHWANLFRLGSGWCLCSRVRVGFDEVTKLTQVAIFSRAKRCSNGRVRSGSNDAGLTSPSANPNVSSKRLFSLIYSRLRCATIAESINKRTFTARWKKRCPLSHRLGSWCCR